MQLALVSSAPGNGTVNFARDASLNLTFSADLDAATVTPANITLTSSAVSSTLALAVNGNQVILTPSNRLAASTVYTLTLGTGLAGTAGQRLASGETIIFTTGDKSWNAAQPVSVQSDTAPQIAVDKHGNAIAVWLRSDGTVNSIYGTRYTPAGGWGTPQPIETGSGAAASPRIAIDGDGNAIVVWRQYDGATDSIYANSFTPTGGWGTEQPIETQSDSASEPQIAFDGSGNAMAVWSQTDAPFFSIYANRYTPTGGWGTEQQIGANHISADNPQVVFDDNGDATAAWSEYDGTTHVVFSNRYTPSGGWGAAQSIQSGVGNAFDPQLAFDGSSVIATWRQYDGSAYSIYANLYTLAGGWGGAQPIETGSGDAAVLELASDGNSNTMAVWGQNDGIYANHHTLASGWEMAQLIESGSGAAFHPHLAMDAGGNAMAVWAQNDGTVNSIYASRYTLANGWETARLIENGEGVADNPRVAFDTNGNAMAVWNQTIGGISGIYINRFDQ